MEKPTINRLNIKQWAAEDRPREKLIAKGTAALSDAELLAILIGSGNTEETAVELARRILKENQNSLDELARLNVQQLCKRFKGIGMAKAVAIVAALEIGRRRRNAAVKRTQIKNSQDAGELFAPLLGDLSHEETWMALLNQASHVIELQKISQGGLSATVVDIRLIVKAALDKNATRLILSHNHPSGNPTPSHEDMALTTKLKEACKLFDINLLDHIIIAGNERYSFTDNNLL